MATIALVGNPNCGKTTVFNALTGARQRVGNWPGVTVERKEGTYRSGGRLVTVVDLPGIYSLDVADTTFGLDEQIARNYLLSGEADLVVNILDAANLERNLYLTTQLLDMEVPLVIALNMMDVARRRQWQIDVQQLSQKLGCPVVPMCAHRGQGIPQLKRVIDDALAQPQLPQAQVDYPPDWRRAVEELLPHLGARKQPWYALYLLQFGATDGLTLPALDALDHWREHLQQLLGEDLDLVVADARYGWIHRLVAQVVTQVGVVSQTTSDAVDRWVLNRWLGIPIFLGVMYLMFWFAIHVGGALIDFFDQAVGAILVEGVAHVLAQWQAPGWLIGLLADGVGGGIQTTATFIPQIGLLFVCLAVLEDSGYLARAAFVMDRLMRWMGLPGKAFVPMLVGFGCNIPGIMATRTLENAQDRLLAALINHFMSCGARLPVYALICAAFFPRNAQNVVFVLYGLGIGVAIFTALVLKKTLLPGPVTPFVLELPPYHVPSLRGVLLRAWERLRAFIWRAGRMIVLMVVILGLLNSVGVDGSFGKKDSPDSLLSAIGRGITPVFQPMGIQPDNWPATVGLFTGMFAKEVMVGTMDNLYSQLAQAEMDEPAEPFDLGAKLQAAVATIPENLAQVWQQLGDPLGWGILTETADPEAAAEIQQVHRTTFGQMALRFGTPTAAVAFLLFVLLYFPCVSATAAVYRETNLGWTVFIALWTTGMGYWAATGYYQLMTWREHPRFSTLWLGGLVLVLVVVLLGMSWAGRWRRRRLRVRYSGG